MGNIKQPWTVVQPKENSQFLFSPLERRHQPRPGLREFPPGQPPAGQTCSRKVPAVTTSAFPHNATKIHGSCPQRSSEAMELSQGRLEGFCFLTGESVERLPPPDTPNTERAYQDFCESLLSAGKQRIPRGRRKNYVPCWDKECERDSLSLVDPSPSGARPYSPDYNRRSRSDGRKLSTPSTSRTLAERPVEPQANLLTG